MFSLVGDHTEEIIHLPNRMCIKIDFGSKQSNDFGFDSCNRGPYRRIRLFDKKENLISETIEENMYYDPKAKFPDGFFDDMDPKILY